MQLWGSAQQKGVEALATLDERLEKTPLLEELNPNELPDEVTDRDGKITQDCSEVTLPVLALPSKTAIKSRSEQREPHQKLVRLQQPVIKYTGLLCSKPSKSWHGLLLLLLPE